MGACRFLKKKFKCVQLFAHSLKGSSSLVTRTYPKSSQELTILTICYLKIWFQNRRQMTRRKRNTWQPNEITSIIRSSQDSSTSPTSSLAEHSPSSQELPCSSGLGRAREDVEHGLDPRIDSIEDHSEDFKENHSNTLNIDRIATPVHLKSQLAQPKEEEECVDGIREIVGASSEDNVNVMPQIGRIVENPAVGTMIESVPQASKDAPVISSEDKDKSVSASAAPRRMERTSSMVRLSTSLDGKASVILKGDTPSPPSKPQLKGSAPRSVLQRSKSLLSEDSLPHNRQPILPMLRTHGRSRDARTWEFYCDSDVRESLTKTADHGQRGSAAGPIQLIRSGSASRQPLGLTTSKQNGHLQRLGSSKRKNEGIEKTKPKLARTTSSFARMQHSEGVSLEKSQYRDGKSSTQPSLSKEPSGDSDKENWEPGTQRTYSRPKPTAAHQLGRSNRRVLQDNASVPSHSTSLGALMEQERLQSMRDRKRSTSSKELELGLEGDRESVISGKGSGFEREEDELDAVQNLLSLSQGAWA